MTEERTQAGMSPEVATALADPALIARARAGAPIVVAEGNPAQAIFANAAALALFGSGDLAALTRRLFVGGEPAARRLAEFAASAPLGAARVERLGFGADAYLETLTFLCKRTSGRRPLCVLAGLFTARAPLPPPAAASLLEAPAAAPASADFAALKADFERRFPGLPPARFLWRTDAAHVVTEVTPPLAEIVGARMAALVGRNLAAVAAEWGIDPQGRLAEALRGSSAFGGVECLWPLSDAAAAAPTTLGALPVVGADRLFEGWRGYGVIHLDRLQPLPAPIEKPPVELSAERPVEVRSTPEFSGVVVPLRPFAALKTVETLPIEARPIEARPIEAPPAEPAAPPSELVALAPHERNAFWEIARALGVRTATDRETPVEPSEPEPEPFVAEAAPAAEMKQESGLAEALPFGLLAARGETPVYANALLLGWLGLNDVAALSQAGGIKALLASGEWPVADGARAGLTLRGAQGETFAVDAWSAEGDWDGAPARIHTFARPSSAALEQRAAVLEAGLRQREAETAETMAIVETAADGVALLNAEGAILGLNRAAENLFGQGRDSAVGQHFTLLLAPQTHKPALEAFVRLKGGARNASAEATGRAVAGPTFPLHLAFGRLGAVAQGKFCLILRDMTATKQAEAALEQAKSSAESGNQAKSEFLARISHEIRTPLNAILGFAEVMIDERFGAIGNERYREYLKDIHASGAHVMSLVNDLLDLSKIEAGRLDLNFAAVDANRIVSECVSLIQPQANRERVITRLALAPRLPAILADERSLRQIVLNLLSNAVRYNEPGGQVIVSTAFSDAGHAVLRVKDTGIGMSESELQTAMEPFRQVSPARAQGGTGLGLPLTKALADANMAAFAIRSRKNEGTLVEVTFPLAPGAAAMAPAAEKLSG